MIDERFYIVAKCCGLLSEAQLIAYRNTIWKLVESSRKAGYSHQRVILYDDQFRWQLAQRAQAGDPDLNIDDELLTADKTLLLQVDQRLPEVLKGCNVHDDAGRGGGSAAAAATGSSASDTALKQLQKQNETMAKNQKEMLDAIKKGTVMHDKGKGKGKDKGQSWGKGDTSTSASWQPGQWQKTTGEGNQTWPKRGREWVDQVKHYKKSR